MKKLLLSVILFACAAAKADVVLETTFKEGDREAVAQTVVLSESANQAVLTLNEKSFKVVVTKMFKNEEGIFEFAFDFFNVVDGVENLVAQPEIHGLPATITIGETNGEASSLLTFVVNEVETNQEVQTND